MRAKTINKILIYIILFSSFLSCSKSELYKADQLWKSVAIQHQGRVKPFDTFARNTLHSVYGKNTYKSKSAVETVLLWLILPKIWNKAPLILVKEKRIKNSLDLSLKQKHFSFDELSTNQKLALQLIELQALKQKGEDLDAYFQDLDQLQTRIALYSSIQTGFLIRVEPPSTGSLDLWHSLTELTPNTENLFKKLITSYVALISQTVSNNLSSAKLTKTKNSSSQNSFLVFKQNMQEFKTHLKRGLKNKPKIKAEIFYNHWNSFKKAYIFYFLFLVAVILLSIFKKMTYFKYTLPLVAVGFTFHSLGLFLRSYIMSRPPVSNMFETVIWVPFVALIAGSVFYLKGNKWPFIASVTLSFVCLLLTTLAPEVLDGRLQPLEAVLRSSFWLSTHVLMITMSYSFFFLAFVLGDMALISYLVNKKNPLSFAKKMYLPMYHNIQWGVILLAGGTILGAVWADYSWGRFWGWDPKESWALISLLAYLAILHGKLIGWIQVLSMAVSCVLMFFLVIMAWYGVNFVLGAGLHSYGFGSGGIEYVFAFFILHLILCFLVFVKFFAKKKELG